MLKTYLVHINDDTYYLKHVSQDMLLSYLVEVCGHNPNNITIEEVLL